MLNKNLKAAMKKIAEKSICKAEEIIGASNGAVKLDYAVNLIIDELKKIPMPVYLKLAVHLLGFFLKPEVKKEVQQVFNEIRVTKNA